MPIIRCFAFVGARYLSAPVEHASAADPDRTIIRIASARSLPEKIVFDMRPYTVMPMVAQAAPVPEHQAREAMAAMPAASGVELKKEAPARVSAPAPPHPKRSAELSRRTPDRRLAFERQDPFAGGWW
jgi:hypothetical protein